METLQVQSAGAATPSLPASTVVGSSPSGVGSFALTLGCALAGMPDSVQEGSPISPKASPSEKGTAGGSSDSGSMAGVLLNCFVASIPQSASTAALRTEPGAPTVSLQNSVADSPSGSAPSFDSSLNTAASETTPNAETLSSPVVMVGVATPATPSAGAGHGVGPMGTAWRGKGAGLPEPAKAEASAPTARARGQVTDQFSGLVETTGQKQLVNTPTPHPVSAPAWVPGLQKTSPPSQP